MTEDLALPAAGGLRAGARRSGWRRHGWRAAFAALFLVMVYLSFRPDPAIASVPLAPHWFAAWLDRHDFLKNVLGFACFTITGLQAWQGWPSADLTVAWGARRARWRGGRVVLGVIVLALLLELGQGLLPRRSSDGRDVLAASVGAAVAWAGKRGVERWKR